MLLRDLKPENILIDVTKTTIRVKICDFGLARIIAEQSVGLSEFCGSPGFFAPEVLLEKSYSGHKADIFSLGCIALELLLSQPYFNDNWICAYALVKKQSPADFRVQIKNTIDIVSLELKRTYPSMLAIFVGDMIDLNPRRRPSVEAMLSNEWIMEGDVLDAIAKLNGLPKPIRRKDGTVEILNEEVELPAIEEVAKMVRTFLTKNIRIYLLYQSFFCQFLQRREKIEEEQRCAKLRHAKMERMLEKDVMAETVSRSDDSCISSTWSGSRKPRDDSTSEEGATDDEFTDGVTSLSISVNSLVSTSLPRKEKAEVENSVNIEVAGIRAKSDGKLLAKFDTPNSIASAGSVTSKCNAASLAHSAALKSSDMQSMSIISASQHLQRSGTATKGQSTVSSKTNQGCSHRQIRNTISEAE